MLGVEITPEKKTLEINTMQERQLPDREKVGKLSTDSGTLHSPHPTTCSKSRESLEGMQDLLLFKKSSQRT